MTLDRHASLYEGLNRSESLEALGELSKYALALDLPADFLDNAGLYQAALARARLPILLMMHDKPQTGQRVAAIFQAAAAEHFGTHGNTVLLFGVIGLLAVVIGCLARRSAAIGVAGLAALGLLGAFVVITRPASHASDVIPSAIGGVAGIVALLWLARASAPVAPPRPASGGGRRRTR